MTQVKLHLPRNDPNLFGLRTPNHGAPPTGYDPTPKIITDEALIKQLRDAMKPQTHPAQRALQRTRPRRGRPKTRTAGKPRTAEELATLLQWHEDGLSLREIAEMEQCTINEAAELIRTAKKQTTPPTE